MRGSSVSVPHAEKIEWLTMFQDHYIDIGKTTPQQVQAWLAGHDRDRLRRFYNRMNKPPKTKKRENQRRGHLRSKPDAGRKKRATKRKAQGDAAAA